MKTLTANQISVSSDLVLLLTHASTMVAVSNQNMKEFRKKTHLRHDLTVSYFEFLQKNVASKVKVIVSCSCSSEEF